MKLNGRFLNVLSDLIIMIFGMWYVSNVVLFHSFMTLEIKEFIKYPVQQLKHGAYVYHKSE